MIAGSKMPGKTRRQVIAAIGAAAAATPGLQGQHQHAPELLQIAAAYQPKVLNAAEMAYLARLTDAIIPRTETPGAADAGVPAFIDRRLAGNSELTAQVRAGMAALDAAAQQKFGAKFAALDPARAVELLTPISTSHDELGRFFTLIKEFTIDGYYASREGLAQELGWHGNTYLTEFKGCTHPEHQK
jgi:gluconate 2-dehydrogenase gamma chain